jgi:cobalt-zinc-cadmium resistance protein CzcA
MLRTINPVKLFEQEVNKAQISLENQKLPELIGGVYWQTFKHKRLFKTVIMAFTDI